MKVHQIFFRNSLRNFCYLINFDDHGLFCIDPFSADEVLTYLRVDLKAPRLSGIINTHDHCDHYSGNEKITEAFPCPVYAHPEARIPHKTHGLKDKEIIYQSGPWTLETVYTPGHTMTHICLLVKKDDHPHALFTGDCFFNAGVGNCHNGGDPEVMYETIQKHFVGLPDDLLIYPGHEYLKRNLEFGHKYEPGNPDIVSFLDKIKTVDMDRVHFINSMQTERNINLFLRLESQNLRQNLNLVNESNKKVFLTLRELRNRW